MSLAQPGNFTPYEICFKTIVYTLIADLPYGEKFNVTVKNFLTVALPVLYNEKDREMNKTAIHIG
jgi:hypothetical protein